MAGFAHINLPFFRSSGHEVAAGEGDLHPLSASIARQLRMQCAGFDPQVLRYRRCHSDFPGAIADLEVYDQEGRLVIRGREFPRQMALWTVAEHERGSWRRGGPGYKPPLTRILS